MAEQLRDKIYKALIKRYESEKPEVLKEMAYNLALASTETTAFTDTFWQKADRAVSKLKQTAASPLAQAAEKKEHAHLSSCPICKNKMNLVKLLEDRLSYYCSDHKICQPLPVGE